MKPLHFLGVALVAVAATIVIANAGGQTPPGGLNQVFHNDSLRGRGTRADDLEVNILPDGGLDYTGPDGGIVLGRNIDIDSLKIKGVTAMSRPSGATILDVDDYRIGGVTVMSNPGSGVQIDVPTLLVNGVPFAGGTGSVSVVQVDSGISPGVNWKNVNVTTEGTIDWTMVLGTNNNFGLDNNLFSKVGAGHVLARGIQPIYDTGTNPVNGCSSLPSVYNFTWTAHTGGSTAAATVADCAQGVHAFNTSAPDRYGMEGDAPALTTQLVFRQYMNAYSMTNIVCTGTLSDGSGSASTPALSVAGNVNPHYFYNTWTYHASTAGAVLRVVCVGTPIVSGSWGNEIDLHAETLGTI